MCLRFYTRTTDYNPAIKTAKKDMTVYKIVELRPDNTYRSQYILYKYSLGVHYNAGVDWPDGCVYTGLSNPDDGEYTQYIYGGYHSYDNLTYTKIRLEESWDDNIQTYIVQCRIPKGAKYIVGMNHDIVSSEIIIDKQL